MGDKPVFLMCSSESRNAVSLWGVLLESDSQLKYLDKTT